MPQRHCATVTALLCAATASSAFATNATWISPTSGTWLTPANWSTNPAVPNAIDDFATLGSTPIAENVTLNGNVTLANLTFDSRFAYTLSSSPSTSTLTLQTSAGPAAITITSNLTTGNTLISAPLTLLSNTTLTNNATGHTLTLSGKLAGTANLTIGGPAPVTFTGSSTSFSGNLIVNASNVNLNSNFTLGASTITLNPGSQVNVNSAGTKNFILNGGTLALNSGNGTAVTAIVSADSLLTSSLHGPIPINALSGAANLTLASADVTFTGNTSNTSYTGALILNSRASFKLTGALPNATVTVNPGAQFTFSLPVGTNPTTNSLPPGAVVSNGGEVGAAADIDFRPALSANSTLAGILFNTIDATLAGSNTLDINALPNPSTVRVGGTGSIASTMDIRPDIITHTFRFGLPDAKGLTVNATLSDHDSASDNLDIDGGTTTLAAANTFSGITTVSNGILEIANANALGTASGTDADGTIVNANGTLAVDDFTLTGENVTLNPGGTLAGASPSLSIYNNPITINGGTLLNATFSGPLSGSGNVSITNALLTNANNFTGNLSFVGNSSIRGTVSLHNLSILSGILTLGNQTIGNQSFTSSTTLQPALTIPPQSLSNSTASSTTTLQSLTIAGSPNAWTAGLDVTYSNLILQDALTHNATVATLQNLVNFGRTHSAGIIDSALASNFALAVLDNAVTHFSTFGGQPVDANSVLVAPQLLGDANVDGKVDLTDLSTVLNNFGTTTPNWTDGNFDGAATIDLTDLSAVLNNFGLTNPNATTSSFNLQPLSLPIPTPEPASLIAMAPAAGFLLRRRNRTCLMHADRFRSKWVPRH